MLFNSNVFGKQYFYEYNVNYNVIRIWISVIIPDYTVNFYMNTIVGMQNEKDFFYHCNEFEYNRDFEPVFGKIDDALLVYLVLSNNACLYEIDYCKFLW